MKIEPRRAVYMAVCALSGAAKPRIDELCNGDAEAIECVDKALQAISAYLYAEITEKWTKDGIPDEELHS